MNNFYVYNFNVIVESNEKLKMFDKLINNLKINHQKLFEKLLILSFFSMIC